MKNLYYIANIRFPTEKAHGIQIIKTCESFANNKIKVELVVTNRKTDIYQNPFEYYGVKKLFSIKKLWCLDTVRFGRLGFLLETFTFAKRVLLYTLFKKGIFYTRDEMLAFFLSLFGKKVFWEAHMGQKNIFVKFLISRKTPIIVISRGLRDFYLNMGVRDENISVSPDGVDLEQFDVDISKECSRERLELEKNKKLVIYTGSNLSWKGVDVLEEANSIIDSSIEILVISGKPYKEIPLYLKAADILVLPNSSKEKISNDFTSPMKLFEYMTSKRPIIASNIPSIREVVNEKSCYFFEPDNPKDLVRVIGLVLNSDDSHQKALQAFEDVKEYTWNVRSQKIINFLIGKC